MEPRTHVTKEQIMKMLYQQLSVEESEQIQKHIAECTYCAELFAEVMEQGYLIESPPDMKENILNRAGKMKKRKEYSKKMQLFCYSLRVGLAMCFALLILIVTDIRQVPKDTSKEIEGFHLELLNNINHDINEVTTKIITMEVKKDDTEKE